MHRVLSAVAVAAPLYLLYLCTTTDAGIVRRDNLSRWLELYDYDNVIHVPNVCKLCAQERPARAKHCEVCNVCVARFDHHCRKSP